MQIKIGVCLFSFYILGDSIFIVQYHENFHSSQNKCFTVYTTLYDHLIIFRIKSASAANSFNLCISIGKNNNNNNNLKVPQTIVLQHLLKQYDHNADQK